MKQIIYLITIISLQTSCLPKTNNNTTEQAIEVTATADTTRSVEQATETVANEIPTLELTPLGNSGEFDFPQNSELTETYEFSQNGKLIIQFNETLPVDTKTSGKVSGKIIINGKGYQLNKSVRNGDSGYTISGEGVIIKITETIWNGDDEGGDCQEGKVPTIKISLGNQFLELKNIKVDYCVVG